MFDKMYRFGKFLLVALLWIIIVVAVAHFYWDVLHLIGVTTTEAEMNIMRMQQELGVVNWMEIQ